MRSLLFAIVVVCLVGVLGVAAQQQPSPAPGQPTFRGTTDLVRVFVTVQDRDGRLVTNLTKDTFEVRDDGKAQEITTFDNTPLPIRLVVMLDCSGSMSGNLALLRESTQELFTRLGAKDAARVGQFGNDVIISPEFTRDVRELDRAMPTYIEPNAPTPLWRAVDEAMNRFHGNPEKKEDTDDSAEARARRRAAKRAGAVSAASDGNAGNGSSASSDSTGSNGSDDAAAIAGGEMRPVVLVLSDGKDSGPIGFNARYVGQVDVIDRARKEGVMIYGIGMRSREAHPRMPGIGPGGLQAALLADLPDPGLAKVAEETGGGYAEVKYGQDLGAAFARVADELHSQYLLGYAPPKKDGKTHKIDVRVSQRGMEPRARKSYVASKS